MTRKRSGKEQKTGYNQYVTKLLPGYQTVTFCTICTPPPLPKGLVQGGRELQHPAIETGMIHLNAALVHHFFQLPIADGIRYLLTHTPKDEVPLKLAALEIHDGCFAI